eukprot:jgi/Tetstr1/424836/TSEL_015339.t1
MAPSAMFAALGNAGVLAARPAAGAKRHTPGRFVVRAGRPEPASTEAPAFAKAAVSLAAAAALSFGTLAPLPAGAANGVNLMTEVERVETVDKELTSSFDVDFGGIKVNHKDLIYGVFVGQWVALIGAGAGGWAARERSKQVEELNIKLMQTNRTMRKQMNREVHSERSVVRQENESQQEVVALLREGKKLLKEKRANEAKACFERALVSIASAGNKLNSPWKAERKARRGLGAAAKQLGEYEEAERNLLRVCELCETMLPPGEERPELADAYGVLADMYTEWGKLDKAGEIYDKMIVEMASV